MDMDISMDIHAKSVDMDMDMDGKFHIHGNPAVVAAVMVSVQYCWSIDRCASSSEYLCISHGDDQLCHSLTCLPVFSALSLSRVYLKNRPHFILDINRSKRFSFDDFW